MIFINFKVHYICSSEVQIFLILNLTFFNLSIFIKLNLKGSIISIKQHNLTSQIASSTCKILKKNLRCANLKIILDFEKYEF